MGKALNLKGQCFGKLVVLERLDKDIRGQYYWHCKCECGNFTKVIGSKLKNGHTKSCGCLIKEKHFKLHSKTNTRIYRIYWAMLNRCYNKNTPYYNYYGGRGIKVCDEWAEKKNGFLNFYNWSIENGYNENLTIDRINVNGNYEPSNCRWSTRYEQANNTRKIKYYEYNGKKYSLSQLSKILGINYNTLRSRVFYLNWDLDKCFKKEMVK